METKRLFLVMLAGMLIILGWDPMMHVIARQFGYELKTPATQPIASTNPTTIPTDGSAGTTPTFSLTTPSTSAVTSQGDWSILSPATPSDAVEYIGSDAVEDKAYALQLGISPRGAGLERAVLNNYQLTLRSKDRFTFELPSAPIEQTRALAVRGVTIDGTNVDLTGAMWSVASRQREPGSDRESVTMELTLARQGTPALTIQRVYTVYKRDANIQEANGQRYEPLGLEPSIVTGFKNLTDKPMSIALRFNSLLIPPSESERGDDLMYIVGLASNSVAAPTAHYANSISATQTDFLHDRKDKTPYWVGAGTTYFLTMFRFDAAPGTNTPVDWFASVNGRTLTPDTYGADRSNEVVIATKPLDLAPAATASINGHAYLGPKKREVLTNAHYAAPWIQFDRALVITSGPCAICTWQWLIDILFVVLKTFHALVRDWGLAIIGLVFLVRLALHPITKRAQLNMLKFGKLAPEMDRIKKKYADDQETMNREMMRFYREHGSTQIMGCLPMFLQMPVWIALWQAMNTTFELRHQPFLYGFTWIHDLSKPDHLIDFAKLGWKTIHLPILSFVTISGLNVLPFLFGILQFIQFKIQPKPPTMTPEQEQQQKMMQWMMLILMPIILYPSPSGLMIYMITSFILGIIESKIVKRQFEAMSANEARFTVVEDDGPRPANVQKATVKRAGEPKKKGIMAMLAEARERAEAMQREMEKNRKKPK